MIAGRDVVNLDTFSAEEIRWVVAQARAGKRDRLARRAADARVPDAPLTDRVLAMVFFDPSLRTRLSFVTAFETLGGTAVDMTASRDLWPLEFQERAVMDGLADEHVCDAAGVLSEYADLIAIRALAQGDDWSNARRDMIMVSFQKHATVPIFNMESVLDHPCQAWGDALTLTEAFEQPAGKRIVIAWTPHPKPRPLGVPHGVGIMASMLGMHTTIAHPPGYELDPQTLSTMRRAAAEQGGSLEITHDLDSALDAADVVYGTSWGSTALYADPEADRARRASHAHWRLTQEHMARTNDARFLHAMPIRRNVEVDDAVVDGPASLVMQQAGNRVHIQRALFRSVLGQVESPAS